MIMKKEKTEALRAKIDRFLSNNICTACDTLTELGNLHKADYDELLRLASKYGIDTEDEEWTE